MKVAILAIKHKFFFRNREIKIFNFFNLLEIKISSKKLLFKILNAMNECIDNERYGRVSFLE